MLNVTSDIYRLLADRLRDAVGTAEFFSGRITVAADNDYELIATLLLYRSMVSDESGARDVITNVVPVWWEFHSFTIDGEVLNDFDFAEFRREVID